jgi:hypothetical protein
MAQTQTRFWQSEYVQSQATQHNHALCVERQHRAESIYIFTILSQHPPLPLALPFSPTTSHQATVALFYVTHVDVALVAALAQLASHLMHVFCTYTNNY